MLLDPATGSSFFGRNDILTLLKKRADDLRSGYRQNIAIIGPSYYGKTSLIYRFISILQSKEIVPIYIEVKPQGFSAFAEKFMSTLLFRYLENVEYRVGEIGELIPAAADKMPRTVKAVRAAESLVKSGKNAKAFRTIMELPAIAYAETGLRPIIILDEFHRLGDFGMEDAFAELGKFIMVQKDTMYVVTSSRIKQAREILSEKLSLLFGNFEVCELGTFDSSDACEFIDTRLADRYFPVELREFLAAFTDGHPFYLDCILLNLEKHLGPSPACDYPEMLVKVFTEILFDSKGILNQHFSAVISDLEDVDRRLTPVLLTISNGMRKHQDIAAASRIVKGEVTGLLEKLMDAGRISKYGTYYLIRDKVFEIWLKSVYHSKEYLLDNGYEPKISRFQSGITDFIASFVGSSCRDRINILDELFMSFDGELIELCGKNLKIPRFASCKAESCKTEGISYIVLSGESAVWALLLSVGPLRDNHIFDFISYCKRYKDGLKRKIIIAAADVGANAKLLAKEAKCLIWGMAELNTLLDIAGKQRLILPVKKESLSGDDEGIAMDEETA